jgi:cell division protein FtsZ
LGEDAKVTILATGLEDELRSEVAQDAHRNEDDFYEDLISLLYKPVVKTTVGEVITKEPHFEVEQAPEPEPAKPEPVVKTDSIALRQEKVRTALDKLKEWLNSFAE